MSVTYMLIYKGLRRPRHQVLTNEDFLESHLRTLRIAYADYTGLHLPWVNISWTADASLKFMDSLGIERAILSISTPGIPFGASEEVKDIARKVGHSLLALHCPALP